MPLLRKIKKLLPLIVVALAFFGVLGVNPGLPFSSPEHVAAQTTDCPKDPHYAAAGSFQIPIGQQGDCHRQPSYTFSGDPESPTITYGGRNESGNVSVISTLTLVDPAADPLVWRGTANYDNHPIELVIPRSGFTSGGSGSNMIRTDNKGKTNEATRGIRIGTNDIAEQFAESQGIVISAPANLDGDCGEDTNGDGRIDQSECGILSYLVTFINVLSALVGLVIVIMIAVRGIQYSFARDNVQMAASARDGIRDAVLALLYYLAGFAFLQWLIPGGVF